MNTTLFSRRGSAIVITMIFFLIVSFLMVTGYQLITTSFKESKYQQTTVLQAENAARAGIMDAISWFRRQSKQPVRKGTEYAWADGAFNPKTSTDPVHNDTIDQNIGLVKEYQLSQSNALWARYEVKRQSNPASVPYEAHAVHDITGDRMHTGGADDYNGAGIVWYVESTGYIYRRRNSSKAYNALPNEIVGRARVSTEIRRITLNLPSEAAFFVNNPGTNSNRTVKIYDDGRINGGTKIGCSSMPPSRTPSKSGTGYYSSYQVLYASASLSTNYIFGVSTSELKSLADYVASSVDALPTTLPDMSLIYIDGDATFTSAKPLRASGILFVNGDLTLQAGSNSLFSGFIYVMDKAYIYAPCFVSGSMIAYNGMTLSASAATDVAEIDYDKGILSSVRQQICQYRENKSIYRVFTGIPGN
jgi:hypothetical protein